MHPYTTYGYNLPGTYQNLDGGYTPFNTYEGSVLLIEAFSTTCGACIDQHSTMQTLYSTHESKAVIISLSINQGDSLQSLNSFVDDHPTSWNIGLDPDQSLADRESVTHTPSFILYDKEGTRQFFHTGKLDLVALQNLIDAYYEEDSLAIENATKTITPTKEPKPIIGEIFSNPGFQMVTGLIVVLVIYFQLTKKPVGE
ncbi:MAG: TlpA family protein disulfide reductase [Candidatus Kariarchaeaceae archaeon]|jgi:hypothetical protein